MEIEQNLDNAKGILKDKIPQKFCTLLPKSSEQTKGIPRTKKFGNPKDIKEKDSMMKNDKGFCNDKLRKTRRNESIYTT